MKNAVSMNGQSVSFEVVDGAATTTSLDIASVFEKRHADIIAKIEDLPQDSFTERNFPLSEYQDSTGRNLPMYKITRDGFSLLVMGFTGTKAYYWKIEFINAFNKMEQMLKEAPLHVKDANALNIIANAMQTMLTQNNTMLELLKQNQKPSLADKPNTRMYHKKLSNEEKFIERVINLLKKEEGVCQKYILETLGKRQDDRTAKRWLYAYHGIYWKAEYSGVGNTYSYSLIEE